MKANYGERTKTEQRMGPVRKKTPSSKKKNENTKVNHPPIGARKTGTG